MANARGQRSDPAQGELARWLTACCPGEAVDLQAFATWSTLGRRPLQRPQRGPPVRYVGPTGDLKGEPSGPPIGRQGNGDIKVQIEGLRPLVCLNGHRPERQTSEYIVLFPPSDHSQRRLRRPPV